MGINEDVVRLTITYFDGLENNELTAESKEEFLFYGEENKKALFKCDQFLRSLKGVQIYLGWNGKVYPIFTVEKITFTENK